GEHPEGGGPIQVLSGRYGPYVKHGKINATIPKEIKPEAVTVEQAVGWLAAKAVNGSSKPVRGRKTNGAAATKDTVRKTTRKKATSRASTTKATSKKSAAKRTTKKATTSKPASKKS